MPGETILTSEGDTTNTGAEGDQSAEAIAAAEAAAAPVVEKFNAEGKPDENGTFDKEGKAIEADKPADKSGDEKTGAPETYENFTLPENVTISESDMQVVSDLFKEGNLTQEMAQKFIDYQSSRTQAWAESMQNAQEDAFKQQQETWMKELKEDKDFGGDNLDSNTGLAVKVINKFGNPELKATLDKSGMGNNPDLIKMFHRIGKAISEDALITDNIEGEGNQKTIADKLYPNQNTG